MKWAFSTIVVFMGNLTLGKIFILTGMALFFAVLVRQLRFTSGHTGKRP